MNDGDDNNDDDDDDDDLSRGAYWGGGGAYKRKFMIYRPLRLAVFHCQTHEGVFLWVINDALMALLGACFQKVYIRRVFSQCELFHIA